MELHPVTAGYIKVQIKSKIIINFLLQLFIDFDLKILSGSPNAIFPYYYRIMKKVLKNS
jgi:hypothetical protein